MPRFTVSDTVTYLRVWTVEAPDAEAAIAFTECRAPDSEEQIGNTPYEAEEID